MKEKFKYGDYEYHADPYATTPPYKLPKWHRRYVPEEEYLKRLRGERDTPVLSYEEMDNKIRKLINQQKHLKDLLNTTQEKYKKLVSNIPINTMSLLVTAVFFIAIGIILNFYLPFVIGMGFIYHAIKLILHENLEANYKYFKSQEEREII